MTRTTTIAEVAPEETFRPRRMAPAAETPPIVRARSLRKLFPPKRSPTAIWSRFRGERVPAAPFVAVDEVSFDIHQGEIFGLLGPNGAGKTTTIRMLSTLLEPTSGSATIHGYDVRTQPDAVRQRLGAVLTGERSTYWKLTGRENLEYFAALYHLPPPVARRRITEVLERLGLAERADDLVERYSTGMKQRLAIARALLASPPLLLLDEPTLGLDPQSARNLRELILDIKREGRTILLTTHYMEEADLLCDRIGIIDAGRVIALDTPQQLKRAIKQVDIIQLDVEHYDPALTDALHRLPTVRNVAAHPVNGTWKLALHSTDSRNLLPGVIEIIGAGRGQIRNLHVAQPTLEDVFISMTGKQLRD